MTTSYWWVCIVCGQSSGRWGGGRCTVSSGTVGPAPSAGAERGQKVRRSAGRAGVEGEDHQGAEHDGHGERQVERSLEDHAGAGPLGVVVDDRPDPVGAVDLSLIHISEPTRLGMISY